MKLCYSGGIRLLLVCALTGIAGNAAAQDFESQQNSKLNIGIVALQGEGDNHVELQQEGKKNILLTFQFFDNNKIVTEQKGPDSTANIYQRADFPETGGDGFAGGINQAFAVQEGPDAEIGGTDGVHYSRGETEPGYFLEFRSGDVDLFTLTENGSIAISKFGRSH
jgi:hypothetical protein